MLGTVFLGLWYRVDKRNRAKVCKLCMKGQVGRVVQAALRSLGKPTIVDDFTIEVRLKLVSHTFSGVGIHYKSCTYVIPLNFDYVFFLYCVQ